MGVKSRVTPEDLRLHRSTLKFLTKSARPPVLGAERESTDTLRHEAYTGDVMQRNISSLPALCPLFIHAPSSFSPSVSMARKWP